MLDLIHSAKGIAVMAHPVMFNNTELLLELIEAGKLDGIEAYHYSATPTQQQKLVDIAKEHDLIVTGGSDFHGLYNETIDTYRKHDPLTRKILISCSSSFI